MALRIVFMGTAELACASLKALMASQEFAVLAVVTQPDRPKGRDLKPQPSPVKTIAVEAGLRVLQPERARDPAFVAELASLQPDVMIVAAYGQILSRIVLDLPKFGCLNVHASLLPKYRGAAPIQWAMLNRESETGVCIMQMAAGLDTGDVVSRRATPILPADTAASLHDRLARIGAELLLDTIPPYVAGSITPQPQDNSASTYARKITKEDGKLDWSQPALDLQTRIRAFTPWPSAWMRWQTHGQTRLLKLWRAQVEHRQGQPGEVLQADKAGLIVACGQDALRIEELQLEGGRRMSAHDFTVGHSLKPGDFIL